MCLSMDGMDCLFHLFMRIFFLYLFFLSFFLSFRDSPRLPSEINDALDILRIQAEQLESGSEEVLPPFALASQLTQQAQALLQSAANLPLLPGTEAGKRIQWRTAELFLGSLEVLVKGHRPETAVAELGQREAESEEQRRRTQLQVVIQRFLQIQAEDLRRWDHRREHSLTETWLREVESSAIGLCFGMLRDQNHCPLIVSLSLSLSLDGCVPFPSC